MVHAGKLRFGSLAKFDSGCGWPSFSKPVDEKEIVARSDRSLLMERTEVRSATANSHLGHVFDDDPGHCINTYLAIPRIHFLARLKHLVHPH